MQAQTLLESQELNACFYDVGVLKLVLFDCWKTWIRNTSEVVIEHSRTCLDIVLSVCALLMDETNVARVANVRALKCINVSKRFVYSLEAYPATDMTAVKQMVEIITGLLDSPPSLPDVKIMMETLPI